MAHVFVLLKRQIIVHLSLPFINIYRYFHCSQGLLGHFGIGLSAKGLIEDPKKYKTLRTSVHAKG